MTEAPAHWEADVVVADGGTVHLRPIRPSDGDALVAFHGALSARTRYLRYFSAYPRIPERDLVRFTHVDHDSRVAFVALLGDKIIAVGRYERAPDTDEAEVAFVVADAHQGRGIGSVLLEHLAAAGRERGVKRFNAVVLAENSAMVRVFRDAGYETKRHLEHGEVTLEFSIDETAMTETVMREREQRAEARSIQRLLYPRSVAVVGASNDAGKIGHAVFANLLRGGFDGTLYPINSEARHVGGVPAYRSVLDVPGELDLVVVAVPAPAVVDVVHECSSRGVRGLVVLSGGFGERGDDDERTGGRILQRGLVSEARANGMRVVGPNCLGVINTDVTVSLNASLAPFPPLAGRAGFFAQSGALGVAVLGEAARRGIGVSTFVSAGNRADVSGNDLLQFWETDERTDVVLMYLESFGNPRKFARLARRLGRTKPIVAVNSAAGTVVAGLASTSTPLPDDTARALFERSGVIRVDTVGDLFDTALLLTSQPLPAGPRVAVVGNSTALAVLVRNACAAEGLSLERIDDVGVSATPDEYQRALTSAVDDETIDAIVAVFVPPLQPESGEHVASALRAASCEATETDRVDLPRIRGRSGCVGRRRAELAGAGVGSVLCVAGTGGAGPGAGLALLGLAPTAGRHRARGRRHSSSMQPANSPPSCSRSATTATSPTTRPGDCSEPSALSSRTRCRRSRSRSCSVCGTTRRSVRWCRSVSQASRSSCSVIVRTRQCR